MSYSSVIADSVVTENAYRARSQEQWYSDSDKAPREEEAISRQKGSGLPQGRGDRGALALTEGRAQPCWKLPKRQGPKEQYAWLARERASTASGASEKLPQRPRETWDAGVPVKELAADKRRRAGTSTRGHQSLGPRFQVG